MENRERAEPPLPARNNQHIAEEADDFELVEPEVERLREELAQERERALRTLAEFDNYRRRTRQERARAEQDGQREILLALLELMDDFERALEHVEEASGPVAEGLRMIHQRFNSLLQANGITSFDSKGRPFDPTMHEALSVVETDRAESGTVYEEVRRGYLWNDELLRPTRVIVVR
ncbi:MAG TPA: nucleotide exchange factor GrpE [Pyrinomonadaceae bacterium]|jgi:molecular chaperone GrpE